jgi:hypothetical protein
MGGFLVSSKHECCCPEMRCCTPETVTATVAGMCGTTTSGTILYYDGSEEDFLADPKNLWPVRFNGLWTICDGLGAQGFPEPSDLIGEEFLVGENCGPLSYQQWVANFTEDDPVWGTCCFPPRTLVNCAGTPAYITGWGFEWGGYETVGHVLCEDYPSMCSRPDGTSWHYGEPTTNWNNGRYAMFDEDLNGTYVLHRPELYLRPQLKCRINRQVPLSTESPYRGVTEAQLLYNVDPKREWVFRPEPSLECWDVLFPPEGDEYVVDYRCGKRNPWYSSSGFGICVRGKCTTTNQGMAKPHLYAYHQSLNQTATLYLKLIPRDYEVDEHGRLPTYWRVGSVQVLDGGTGYSVGEFFVVDYESPQMRQWLGGEIMSAFPKLDMSCFPPYYPTWVDKYGAVPSLDGGDKWIRWQTLRVSEVDGDGGIVSVEVVPIFKQPEFSDPPYCNDERVGEERTKFYVGYGRILCHPRSVQLPGVGYTIGDTIEFYCDDPSCEELEPAIAEVVDVDEEGGILDWEIRGTDAWRYNSQNFCVAPFTVVDGLCTTSCIKEGEPDERGKYRWKAKLLCDLRWDGVGNPVRTVVNAGCNPSLTTLTASIQRVACETSIEVYVALFPFSLDASGGVERVRALFPPYPRCAGGGAVVRPTFGAMGGNESDFGSYLSGGVVEAGGGGYCFRDKYHVEPTLPTEVPAIGDGSGATIGSFSFSAVNNFPNPAMDWGGPAPASSRFSYFPVTGVTVGDAGSGYEVGQTFDVAPEGGRSVSDMWRATGGDSPEECPNGAWYGDERAVVNAAGYKSILYNYETGQYLEPIGQRPSKCTLRVAAVNEGGGITELEVVHGGMMFKPVWGSGKLNQSVTVILQSTLGYGAYISSTFDEDYESDHFGELTGIGVVAPPPGSIDPKHPGIPNGSGGWVMSPQPLPVGGRDYADQSAGYFWMLNDITVGNGAAPLQGNKWSLMAYMPWNCNPWVINPLHPEISTHSIIEGQPPAFVPKSAVCAFSDCYHELLNREYKLVRNWSGYWSYYGWGDRDWPESNAPMSEYGEGRPCTGFMMAMRKGKYHGWEAAFNNAAGELIAEGSDYHVIEYGPTITLAHTVSSPCPDHSNGTTSRE